MTEAKNRQKCTKINIGMVYPTPQQKHNYVGANSLAPHAHTVERLYCTILNRSITGAVLTKEPAVIARVWKVVSYVKY